MISKPTQSIFKAVALSILLLPGSQLLAQTKAEKKVEKLKAKLEKAIEALPVSEEAQKNIEKVVVGKKELPKPVKGVTVEGITEYTLDNGMKVLLLPDQTQQTITVNITYMVGSRHEGYGETGMAHLLEHMVFKGSPKHTDIPKELSDHGARPNGTTSLDRTNYFETFNATEENLRWALDLESDRMVNSFIKKEDLESEYTVVRNEFEMGENNPNSILSERIVSAAYLWHNYGNSTIGSREDLERVPVDKLKDFYKKYYQPDNAVLIVAGKFDPEETLELVNEYFGPIPRPKRTLSGTYTIEPAQDTERNIVLQRVGDVQFLGALYHVPPATHEDYASVDVISDALGYSPSGPLYKALVDTKLASQVFGYARALNEPGYSYFGAVVPKENDIHAAREAFLKAMDEAIANGFSQEEVDRAKSQTARYLEQVTRDSENFAKMLTEFIALGDWRTFFIFRDAVENVTLEDVNRVAKKYFKPSNRTVGMFIPTEEPDRVHIPEAPDVEELVKDYKGREIQEVAEVFEATPENIDSRNTTGTFANGMEYSLISKGTRGNVVSGSMTLRIGNEKSLSNIGMTDNLTASMLMRGTKNLTRQEIKDKLDGMKSSVSIGGGGNTISVGINTTKENLSEVLAIVEDVLKNPSFDQKEFSNLVTENKTGIEANMSQPMAIGSTTFRRIMSPYKKGDIRYVPTFKEQLEMLQQVTPASMKAFHEAHYGTSNATISLVGDFDQEKTLNELKERFGSWENPTKFTRVPNEYHPNPSGTEKIETPDKANALLISGINLKMKDSDPDYPAMYVANYLMGGGFLNSRIATRLRQKDGISYGAGTQFSASSIDENGQFLVYAILAPENSEKAKQGIFEEIDRVRNEGFTEEELAKAKEGLMQSRQLSRSKDDELAGKLNGYLYLDRTMNFDASFDEKLQNLTLEEVNSTFRKYVDNSKLTMVQAGDFAKKFAAPAAEEEASPAGTSGAE
ncbi:M16 family metallopeptidase [Jiulongibacter sediminis]|uniref:M16 family metallopeptidase n=1 Tax=Jiulongibacter sediminis TaxID=1605367 RepID=UPI0009E89CDE|nr:pitrilysin family protein [Jiulongibacter sediminis]